MADRRNGNDFTSGTRAVLGKRVGYKCSRCGKSTLSLHSDPEKVIDIGEGAHICAASPGGPRYDETMTSDQIKSATNGIFLCRECHAIIDRDPEEYPVEKLKKMKEDAENNANFSYVLTKYDRNQQRSLRRYYESAIETFEEKRNDFISDESLAESYIMPMIGEKSLLELVWEWYVDTPYGVMLLYGQPGHGKTTICQKAVYDYAKYTDHAAEEALVLQFPLNQARSHLIDNFNKGTINLENVFHYPDEMYSLVSVRECREKLIFLDGYDEVKYLLAEHTCYKSFRDFIGTKNSSDYRLMSIAKKYKIHFVITSTVNALIKEDIDSVTSFEFPKLTAKQQEQWCARREGYKKRWNMSLKHICINNQPEGTINDLKELLQIPYIFRMVVHNDYRISEGIPDRASLYADLFTLTIERNKFYVDKTLERPVSRKQLTEGYENLAYKIWCDDEDSAQDIENKDILMLAYYIKEKTTHGRYSFIHKSFYSYFMALYLYEQIIRCRYNNDNVCEEFLSKLAERRLDEDILSFFVEIIENSKEKDTLLFGAKAILQSLDSNEAMGIDRKKQRDILGTSERSRVDRCNNIFVNAILLCVLSGEKEIKKYKNIIRLGQSGSGFGSRIGDLIFKDQPIEMFINNHHRALIKYWYHTHTLGQTEKVNEAKVIFLGDGEAGKSLAISRLMNNGIIPDDFDGESTPGIETQIRTYNIENEDVLVHYWDFGGQEILHSMHRMFLTKRTLYVVFVNVRENTQDDRARYWLHNIQSFANGSNVILVLNKMDQNPNATINENALRRLYPNLQDIVRISALRDNVTVFNERLESTIIKNIASMESRKTILPSAWKKLKTELENMDGRYIDRQTYMDICNKCNVDVSKKVRDELIDWMGDLGVCFCYRVHRSLSEYMILNPKWITNAIYIILFNGKNFASHGVISQEKIYELLQNARNYKEHKLRSVLNIDYKNFEIGYILGVIRRFRLSYQLDEENEFLPMLCDNNELPIALTYQNRDDIQEFYLEYEYLPLNVLHQFFVDMHSYLNLEQVWLTGAEFRFDSMNMTALIFAEESKIKIFIKNSSPVYKAGNVLNLILDMFNRINERMGISAEKTLVYKEDGKKDTFDYEEISEAVEYGEVQRYNRIFKRSINLVSLLNHAGAEEKFQEKMLIREVIKSCQDAQDFFPLQSSYEDPKNTYIAKNLRAKSYCAYDQTFGGKSQSGKGPGELDILICSNSDTTLAIYEGLMLNSFLSDDKKSWSKHLKKLVDNYNSRGIQLGFLVSYVNWEKARFKDLYDEYYEYVKQFSFEAFDCELVNISPLSTDGNFTRAMMVHYQFAGMPIRICMICVRFGTD